MEKKREKSDKDRSGDQYKRDRKSSEPEKRFFKKDKPGSDKKSGPYKKERNSGKPERRFPEKEKSDSGRDRKFTKREDRDVAGGENRKFGKSPRKFTGKDKPDFHREKNFRDREKRSEKRRDGENIQKPRKFGEQQDNSTWKEKYRKPASEDVFRSDDRRSRASENSTDEKSRGNSRNILRKSTNRSEGLRDRKSSDKSFGKKEKYSGGKGGEETRLNKYIANSGICSRREADVMISTGVVKVNDEVITTMGYKVKPGDRVSVDGREIKSEKKVYILLNKPKDAITTTDDPSGRKTVMDIVKDACRERVYPVGRLDRNTTGLLILTNDGEMAKRLMHPSHKTVKVYEATLDKNLTREDMQSIAQGVTIEEDFIPVDGIAWPEPGKKNVVGLELHSGKYHVVKRIFEQFGYTVIKLDRTMYGPLTKKNLPRGSWRFLTEAEISILHRL